MADADFLNIYRSDGCYLVQKGKTEQYCSLLMRLSL
jgi:hypothetical protein